MVFSYDIYLLQKMLYRQNLKSVENTLTLMRWDMSCITPASVRLMPNMFL